jgi:hypothetical protein
MRTCASALKPALTSMAAAIFLQQLWLRGASIADEAKVAGRREKDSPECLKQCENIETSIQP